MRLQSLLDEIKQIHSLSRAVTRKRRGDLVSARQRLDQSLSFGDQMHFYSLALAFDGVLKLTEENGDAAHARFLECSKRPNPAGFLTNEYAAAFSRLFLKLLDPDCSFDEVKDAQFAAEAARASATWLARRALPLGSMDTLEELYADRAPEDDGAPKSEQVGGSLFAETRTTTSVAFDF